MKPRVNTYWGLAAVIWSLAIGLTFWNLSIIASIATARDGNERQRNELIFHRQHSGKLESVRLTAENFSLAVDSDQLGFLTLQRQIESLGAVFGLEKVKIARQVGQISPEGWPITISIDGTVEGTVQFLQAVEQYPYLPLLQVRMTVAENGHSTATELQLVFQFHLRTPGDIPVVPMRTTQYQTPNEERRS